VQFLDKTGQILIGWLLDSKCPIRGRKTDDRRQRTDDRGQMADGRIQKTEVRGQKSEFGSGKAEFGMIEHRTEGMAQST
jgi:hypothetical protein